MGIWNRITSVVKGNINQAIDKIESPKLLEQYLRDTEQQLSKFKQDIKNHTANQFGLEQDIKRESQEVERLEDSAEYALRKGNDTKATEFLNEKVAREQKLITLRHEYEQTQKVTAQLVNDYKHLETRLTQLRHRKDVLITQAESSKARKRSYQIHQKIEKPEIGSDFDRIEKKVRRMQAEADAEGYVNMETGIDKWDVSDAQVSSELERLKAKIQSEKTETNTAI